METGTVTAEILERNPVLGVTITEFERLCEKLASIFEAGGKLLVAGNGGSAADAQHIVAELMKSFEVERPRSRRLELELKDLPHGDTLAEHLDPGLPAIALGLNHSLTSAIGNDFEEAHLEYAQELSVLANAGDATLAISTSGRAKNVLYTMATARAKGLFVAALTGEDPGEMADLAHLTLSVPATRTAEVQEMHEVIYHGLCRVLEQHFFGSR
ncbi:MAG: SIS domain-containing protein [Acidobacteriota bacterium]